MQGMTCLQSQILSSGNWLRQCSCHCLASGAHMKRSRVGDVCMPCSGLGTLEFDESIAASQLIWGKTLAHTVNTLPNCALHGPVLQRRLAQSLPPNPCQQRLHGAIRPAKERRVMWTCAARTRHVTTALSWLRRTAAQWHSAAASVPA